MLSNITTLEIQIKTYLEFQSYIDKLLQLKIYVFRLLENPMFKQLTEK